MRCRECLLQLVRALADDSMVPERQPIPKRADLVHWSELIAAHIAGGSSSAEIRGHLKVLARSAWMLVGWLTHASNARHADARIAVSATEAVLVAFGTAVHRHRVAESTLRDFMARAFR